jgi:fimbrial isopeptide formation D2 family protein/LPXTG-motif cell wall-anchored protein
MKTMKKVLALVVAMMVMLSMVAAFADGDTVTITVNRDSSYAGDTSEAGRTFTWYKIFSATYESSISTNASGHTDGVPAVNAGGTEGISYVANATVAAKLADAGNLWFDVQDIAGSTDKIVSWKASVTASAENVQAAAKWLVDNNAYEATGDMTFAGGKWTATVEKGYYVLSSDTGDNVIAATTDITVNEKNDYPPLTKEQKDEDSPTTYVGENGEPLDVAIGDVITYQVTVSIPKAAKVGETIEVWDKASSGLTYNGDVAAAPSTNVADGTLGTGEAWHKIITVTADNKGTDVVFTYTMTINDDALVDTGRKNEAGLKYGDEYESLPHSVEYTTYFTGIQKTDGTDPLEGVKFTLKEAGTAFKVTYDEANGYYIPDANGSSEVVTNADGLILIRGLDKDKTYTLTETETLPGYNMLDEDVTLTLVEDKDDAFAGYTADDWTEVINNQGTVLPSTGGMGTTILYTVGGILVLGAAILLVVRRRVGAGK